MGVTKDAPGERIRLGPKNPEGCEGVLAGAVGGGTVWETGGGTTRFRSGGSSGRSRALLWIRAGIGGVVCGSEKTEGIDAGIDSAGIEAIDAVEKEFWRLSAATAACKVAG